MSVVMTPTSAALSSAHCATVRTLCPTSRLMSQRNVTTRSTTRAARVVGRVGHEDQDVDVGMRVQLAAAVAADRRERPAFVTCRQLRAPHFAQDDVDELGARMHQCFHRFIRAEALDEFGVRIPELDAKGLGCVVRLGESFGEQTETQPGRVAEDRGFGRFEILFE